jgi:hypothetical protein
MDVQGYTKATRFEARNEGSNEGLIITCVHTIMAVFNIYIYIYIYTLELIKNNLVVEMSFTRIQYPVPCLVVSPCKIRLSLALFFVPQHIPSCHYTIEEEAVFLDQV